MDEPTNPEPDEQPDEYHRVPVHDAWRMSEPVAGPPSADHLAAPPAREPTGAPGEPEVSTEPTPGRGWRGASRGQRVLALAAAGVLLAGGVAVAVATSSGASSAGTVGTTAGGPPAGGLGRGSGAQTGPGIAQGPAGVAGEQHIEGTLTAKTGSTVTVQATGGTTATYTVTSDTQVVRDGARTSLSEVQVGDAVLVHVLPTTSGGHKTAERLFAGTLPTGGFGGGGPGNPGTSGGSVSSGADTT
ncbi:MAG TPA: hypothetical protein VGO19_07675 [Actinomycetes bacterium]